MDVHVTYLTASDCAMIFNVWFLKNNVIKCGRIHSIVWAFSVYFKRFGLRLRHFNRQNSKIQLPVLFEVMLISKFFALYLARIGKFHSFKRKHTYFPVCMPHPILHCHWVFRDWELALWIHYTELRWDATWPAHSCIYVYCM